MAEPKSDYNTLTDHVSSQLAASCPALPEEVRVAFAAQIAPAALRPEREVPIAVDLIEPGQHRRYQTAAAGKFWMRRDLAPPFSGCIAKQAPPYHGRPVRSVPSIRTGRTP
jgi:hypothetical protein